MQFQVNGEVFETRDMLTVDVDGMFLTVYALPERGLVFVQTFDEEQGVLVDQATPEQTGKVLTLLRQRSLPEVRAHREWVREAFTSRRRISPEWGSWGKAAVA